MKYLNKFLFIFLLMISTADAANKMRPVLQGKLPPLTISNETGTTIVVDREHMEKVYTDFSQILKTIRFYAVLPQIISGLKQQVSRLTDLYQKAVLTRLIEQLEIEHLITEICRR